MDWAAITTPSIQNNTIKYNTRSRPVGLCLLVDDDDDDDDVLIMRSRELVNKIINVCCVCGGNYSSYYKGGSTNFLCGSFYYPTSG